MGNLKTRFSSFSGDVLESGEGGGVGNRKVSFSSISEATLDSSSEEGGGVGNRKAAVSGMGCLGKKDEGLLETGISRACDRPLGSTAPIWAFLQESIWSSAVSVRFESPFKSGIVSIVVLPERG